MMIVAVILFGIVFIAVIGAWANDKFEEWVRDRE